MALVFALLPLLFLREIHMLETHQSVIFHKTNQVSIANSRWLATFTIDLRNFENFITKLTLDLTDIKILANKISEKYSTPSQTHYLVPFQHLEDELRSLATMRQNIVDTYFDYKSVGSRQKRSLLPIVGKLLSLTFGTLTKSDLKSIRNHINTLSRNQESIKHVLDDSISLMNLSKIELESNRKQLNALSRTLFSVNTRLTNISTALEHEIMNLETFVRLYLQLDLLIADIRDSINKARIYLNTLRQQLGTLALGHINVDLVRPNALREILLEIQKSLPQNIKLPIDPVKDIWSYYKILTSTALLERDLFVVIISIPLVDSQKQFEVYEVTSLQLPHDPKTTPALQNSPHMAAYYDLETTAIAVNTERTQFVILNREEFMKCNLVLVPFCDIRSAIYRLSDSNLCVTSLFRKDKEKVKQNCKIKVTTHVLEPNAKYFKDGLWLISSLNNMTFTMVCPGPETSVIKTKAPLDVIKINQSCSGYTDKLVLTTHYFRETKYYLRDPLTPLLEIKNNSHLQLWEPLTKAMSNFSNITFPPELAEMPAIDMNHMVRTLQRVNSVKEFENTSKLWFYIKIIGLVLIVLVASICVFVFRKQLCELFFKFTGNNKLSAPRPTSLHAMEPPAPSYSMPMMSTQFASVPYTSVVQPTAPVVANGSRESDDVMKSSQTTTYIPTTISLAGINSQV